MDWKRLLKAIGITVGIAFMVYGLVIILEWATQYMNIGYLSLGALSILFIAGIYEQLR